MAGEVAVQHLVESATTGEIGLPLLYGAGAFDPEVVRYDVPVDMAVEVDHVRTGDFKQYLR